MKTILAITTLSLLTTTACKKDEPAGKGAPSSKAKDPGDPAAPAKATGSGPFAAWDLDARRAALQGAHVGPGGSIGVWEAWNVQGDKATIWDGTTEKTVEVAVQSPCEVELTERSADGSSSGVVHHYTLKDGAFVSGLGDAGSRRGAEAVACVSNVVVTVDAQGTCTTWEQDMFGEKWESSPGTCGFAKDGDKEVFKATVNGHESVLLVEGDTIWSEQMAREHSEKHADFAAAKAALAARK